LFGNATFFCSRVYGIREEWPAKTANYTNNLAKFVDQCNKSWRNRLKKIGQIPELKTLQRNRWPNRANKVMKELIDCMKNVSTQPVEKCETPHRCLSAITTIKESEWIIPQSTWVVL
uniref:Transposase n=1 Tax=Gongylonema pulchrum TaxID=637853 RepID=A0A183ERX3_9BILA